MPKAEFFFPGGNKCEVQTADGVNNRQVDSCIRQVANFFQSHSGTKLVYITHGWPVSRNNPWMPRMKDSFLKKYKDGKIVVALVFWGDFSGLSASNPLTTRLGYKWPQLVVCCFKTYYTYGVNTVNAWAVGNVLAYLHDKILSIHTSGPGRTYCIGHSVGSHVCGFFGKKTASKLYKIIALDPAGPIFEYPEQDVNSRLNSNDATRVDVLHTNSEGFGVLNPIGHVDFYVNGGSLQPGHSHDMGCHSFAWELLTNLNEQGYQCVSRWKCDIGGDGSKLADIQTEDRSKLLAAGCTMQHYTSQQPHLGNLNDVRTSRHGVYWMEAGRQSATCKAPFTGKRRQFCKLVCHILMYSITLIMCFP